ncbi:uncharacterized protein LOC132707228 [Cylas formicarius]|uniref:uncharacterized protein LOC132707228 n=1 Tax=Cylas formicarius TaxID=197179 RepID=UPI002958A3E7|nr:uncharacterized protein LOC132707228 [Cylas formicarius]
MAAANFLPVLVLLFCGTLAVPSWKLSSSPLAIFFACWEKPGRVAASRGAAGAGIRTAFLTPREGVIGTIDTHGYDKVTYILDLACAGANELLVEASKSGKFRFVYEWILLSDGVVPEKDVRRMFHGIRTRMDMDVKVVFPSKIVRVYRPGLRGALRWLRVGHVAGGHLVMTDDLTFYESRRHMEDVLIRAGSVAKYPYKTSFDEYMSDLRLKSYDKYSKFHYHAFLFLRDVHRFSYNVTLAPAWYGNRSSGEDGGVAKLLYEDTVDIGIAGGMIRMLGTDRIDFYDYFMPYYRFRSGFYFRNPGVVRPNFYEVLKPLAARVWYAVLVTGLVCCACMEVVWLMEQHRTDYEHSFLHSVLILIGIYAQQGVYVTPKRMAGRIILLSLLILSLLLYNYYTSSLVSSLISTEPETLKTIRELYESKLRVGMELQPYTVTFMLDRSKYDRYLDLLNRTKIYADGKPNFPSVDEGVRCIRDSDFAYHIESVSAYPLIAKTFDQASICDLTEITLIDSDTSLMLQKDSQYRKLFQISLRKTWQSGLLRKVYKTWVGSKPECLSSARVISVGVNDLFLPYFLLFIGVGASFALLSAELAWSKFKKRFRRGRAVYPFTN